MSLSAYAKCCFYREDATITLDCEWMRTTFDSRDEKNKFTKAHCCSLSGMLECGNYKELVKRWEKTG